MEGSDAGQPDIHSKKQKVHVRSLVWIGLAAIVLVLSRVLPDSFFEEKYYNGLFRWIRLAYDNILGWIPFPMIYVVVAFVLLRIVQWSLEWKKGWLYQLTRLLGGIAWVIFFFYVFWGFNYHQRSLQDRLELNLEEVTFEEIEAEFLRATNVLKAEANTLPGNLTNDESITSFGIYDNDLRRDVEKALTDLNVMHSGHVRVRQLWPKGFLLRWNTAGIYIPHAFEGHIDKGMLSVQKPFTLAHEMAHGYGITDEGACNFIAWLACSQSENKWVRFGGAFTYWRYTAAEMPDEKVIEAIDSLHPVVKRAIFLVRENDKKYPDFMPQVRDAIYSTYLKRHGVKGGLRSYNYVVKMVHQYLKSTSHE